MANTNAKSTGIKKNYNPTVTALFENEKFGEGSLLSAPLTAEGFEALQRHGGIGVKFVVKKSKKPNKNGSSTYFMEILPPQENSDKLARRSNNGDDI